MSKLNKTIKNINTKQNITLIIINTNLKPITNKINNDINDKVDTNILSILSILSITIKNTNIKFIANKSNNNIDNKIDISTLDLSDAIIKNINIKPITGWTNNNISMEVNIDVFMDRIISKIETKLTMGRLYKVYIIVRKDLYKSSQYYH